LSSAKRIIYLTTLISVMAGHGKAKGLLGFVKAKKERAMNTGMQHTSCNTQSCCVA